MTLTPRSRSHEVLPSTLNIMWPMRRQNLKLLLPKHYEERRFQENTLFDHWPWPWGQGHTKRRPVPLTSCDLCTGKIWSCYFEKFMRRCIYKKIHYLTFDLDLGGQGHTKCHPVPSTSCDLCTYKVISCYVQRFRRRYNYKKRDGRTDRQTDARTDGRTDRRTDGRPTDFGTKLIYPIFLTKKRV